MRISIVAMVGFVLMLFAAGSAAQKCEPPTISSAGTVETVRAYFQKRGRTVVTFAGYSGADYEDKAAMLARAGAVLDRLDPGTTIVNIGATIDGIGAVYELAKKKGFEATGIVSSQARAGNATIAPCAGTVFFIEDESWEGCSKGPRRCRRLQPRS